MASRAHRASPRRRRTTRRPPAPLRVVASLVAILGIALVQLVQLSHFFLVQHTVCEHGDFIHEAAVKPAAKEAEARANEREIRADSSQDDADHEHCDAHAVRFRAAEIGPSLAGSTLLSVIAIPAQVAHPERRPVAPLELAPKSSPPVG